MTCRWWDGHGLACLRATTPIEKFARREAHREIDPAAVFKNFAKSYQRPHQTDIQTSHRTEVRPALTASPTSRSGFGSPRAKPGTWLRPTPVVCPSDKARRRASTPRPH